MKRTLAWGVAVLVLGMFPVFGEEEIPREVRAKLDREATFTFVETPLSRALDSIQGATGLTIVLDPESGLEDFRVTLRTDGMKAGEVLEWIQRLSGLQSEIRGQVYFLSTPSRLIREHLVSRAYDVRDLLVQITDHKAPQVSLAAGGEGMQFEELGQLDVEPYTIEDVIEYMKRIDPRSWDYEEVTLEPTPQGLIFVRHTEEVHAQIAALLEGFRRQTREMIALDARFIAVDNGLLREIVGEAAEGPAFILEGDALGRIEEALRNGERAHILDSGRTICFNTQRTSLLSTRIRSYVRDVTVVTGVETIGADPEVGYAHDGMVVDIRPTLNTGGRYIIMETRATLARHGGFRGGGAQDRESGAGRPGGQAKQGPQVGEVPTESLGFYVSLPSNSADMSVDNITGILRVGGLDHPEMNLYAVRTTYRAPAGKVVVFSATSDIAGPKDRMQVLLLLRATPVTLE